MVKIGILNLQGAVSEHFDMTRKTVENLKLDIEVEEVRYSETFEITYFARENNKMCVFAVKLVDTFIESF